MSKHTPRDWSIAADNIVAAATSSRQKADNIRIDAISLKEKTTEQLQYTQRGVQNQFSLRLDEIETHRSYIKRTFDEVFAEIGVLQSHKANLEKELLAKELPHQITHECQQLREGRQGIDLVADDVEAQLAKESVLFENVKNILQGKINDCVEQLRLLRAANYQLDQDYKDKSDASQIDGGLATLNTTSKGISLFPNSTRVDSKSVLPEDWKQFTTDNIHTAEIEKAKSVALRENIDQILKETAAQILNQANAVEGAFNLRLSQYSDALNHDKQQQIKTQVSISAQEKLIKSLEDLIAEREYPLMLATTRLEKRTSRPNVELVRDHVQASLTGEVSQIQQTQEQLQAKLQEASANLRSLNRAELALQEDINIKTNSINIDNQCMQRRQQFKYRLL